MSIKGIFTIYYILSIDAFHHRHFDLSSRKSTGVTQNVNEGSILLCVPVNKYEVLSSVSQIGGGTDNTVR